MSWSETLLRNELIETLPIGAATVDDDMMKGRGLMYLKSNSLRKKSQKHRE